MSAETGFAEPQFPQQNTNPRGGNKRKRGPSDSPSGARASPMTRRSRQISQINPDSIASIINAVEQHAYIKGNGPEYHLPSLAPSPNTVTQSGDNGNIDTAARALSYSMQVPTNPAETFMAEAAVAAGEGDQGTYTTADDNLDQVASGGETAEGQAEGEGEVEGEGDSGDPNKPAVGSAEWHRQRKDNHKEVERRRRETINEGINELAKIVPGCEKNKGSILSRTVEYIQELEDKSARSIDEWTFEKLVTEQAISDLSGKLQRTWAEKEAWKRVAREAGVDIDTVDLGLGGDEDQEDGAKVDKPSEMLSDEAEADDANDTREADAT